MKSNRRSLKTLEQEKKDRKRKRNVSLERSNQVTVVKCKCVLPKCDLLTRIIYENTKIFLCTKRNEHTIFTYYFTYLVRNTSIKQYVTLLLVLFLSLILFLYICFFSFSHHIWFAGFCFLLNTGTTTRGRREKRKADYPWYFTAQCNRVHKCAIEREQ